MTISPSCGFYSGNCYPSLTLFQWSPLFIRLLQLVGLYMISAGWLAFFPIFPFLSLLIFIAAARSDGKEFSLGKQHSMVLGRRKCCFQGFALVGGPAAFIFLSFIFGGSAVAEM